jgi:hypothetical protein
LKKQKAKKGTGAKKTESKDPEASTSKDVEDTKEDAEAAEDDIAAEADDKVASPKKSSHGRKESVSVQSKLRSESFRKESHKSPSGATLEERIEDLEKENTRLAVEKEDAEKRWHKFEEEVQELREAQGEKVDSKTNDGAELEKLVCYTRANFGHVAKHLLHREQKSLHCRDRTTNSPPQNAEHQLPYRYRPTART